MNIELGNALPVGKRKPKQKKSYTRAEHLRRVLLRSTTPTDGLDVSHGGRELPATDYGIWRGWAPLLSRTGYSSCNSAFSTKREYRRAILPHLKFSILRIRAGYVGLPGTIFSFFTTLRAAAPGWQAWM